MNNLLRLLPPVRRARGNRLYTADGRRFLDLWLDDGRGILGDRDSHTRTFASNAADKGLTRPYPGLYDARFVKAVTEAWPAFGTVKLFSSEERALATAYRVFGAQPALVDSALRPAAPGTADPAVAVLALARPFAAIPETCDLALPRLPCPRPFAPWCLMARDGTAAAQALSAEEGDLAPAQALVAAARGLASLEAVIRDGYGEALWARFDKRMDTWFERSGPYLFPRAIPAGYEAFFRAALEGGALLSPRPDAPSVIPPDFDDGELAKLARSLNTLN
ncbi:MAG: hypothetical protein A2Y38_20865 [Spirochaetes bacterium GWB1_59_5]|nr:MAG: hypothetical protein A2Y38_20865 [Spirochaetes bacterium GWB1_59_5]